MRPPTEIVPGFAVTAQPDALGIGNLAALGYRTIINFRPDVEEVEQMPTVSAQAEAERVGLAYVHIPVAAGTIRAAASRLSREPSRNIRARSWLIAAQRGGLLWTAAQALSDRADPAALKMRK